MAREYMKFFHSYLEAIEPLSDAQRGRLFTALLRFSATGRPQTLTGSEKYTYAVLKIFVEREMEAYDIACETNRENGKKGGRPRKKEQPEARREDAGESPGDDVGEAEDTGINAGDGVNPGDEVSAGQSPTKTADGKEADSAYHIPAFPVPAFPVTEKTDPDIPVTEKSQDKDKDKDNDNGKDKGGERRETRSGSRGSRPSPSYKEVTEMFNSVCVSLPKVISGNKKREGEVRARLGEINNDLDELRRVFERVEKSDFLSGRTEGPRHWRASFDWVINSGNWLKIREGNYDNDRMSKPEEKPDSGEWTGRGYALPEDNPWSNVFTMV